MDKAKWAGGVGALAVASGLILQTSSAAFTATTENEDNSWTAGTVTLTDNDSDSALFTEAAIAPGHTGRRCIVVTYGGNIAAKVRLRGAITGGDLGPYLNLEVQRGTGGDANCVGFAGDGSPAFTGTLSGLASSHGTFANGYGEWTPSGPTAVTYSFRWTLQDTNAAQGKNVQAAFTWEAQSS